MMYTDLRFTGHILWRKRPIHLTFFVTRRCNLRCPFCFYLMQKEAVNSQPELALEEIEKISSSMRSLLWLAFSGGEVYLRKDIVEISKIFYKNNKPSIMLYPTNGMLPEVIKDITEEILRHCKKSIVVVKLSLDGLYSAHDMLRGSPKSFEKTMQTYEVLSELLEKYPNFELGINTVFCSENQDNMDEIIEFVSGLNMIRTHTLSMIRGNIKDESFKNVDIEKYQNAAEKIEKNLKEKMASIYRFRGARLKAAQDILQRRLIYQTMLQKRRLIPCYAGKLNLVLTETGDVYPCESLNQKMGNVRDYDYNMGKVLRSAGAKNVIHSIQKNSCYCSHECYFMTNILFNPRMYPALAKEYLQL
ncbi:MAG TPA: radical SAM protein [Nitrospiraceae bacterium]|nr:radical SAM protein [Nitrospiraceae bacterium]